MNITRFVLNALALSLAVAAAGAPRALAVEPVYVEIVADQDRTSPDPLQPFDIRFVVHANGNKIQGMVFAGVLKFTNGNIIGTIDEWPNGDAQIVYSQTTHSTFASKAWNTFYGQGSDPDTILLGLTSFSGPWKGTGDMFRIHVTPTDTGTIQYDTVPGPLPPSSQGGIHALDDFANSLPLVVVHSPIHVPPKPGPVRFRILTSSGTDTLFMGAPAKIYFHVDAAGNEVTALTFQLIWDFTTGSFIGPFSDASGEVQYSPATQGVFESIAFSPGGGHGNDPDTSILGLTSFGGEPFTADDWVWSVNFEPADTGTVVIDSNFTFGPPSLWPAIDALDEFGSSLPSNFLPGRIVVLPCPYDNMGDVNQNGMINSSDLIYFVNYVFKSGPDPLPNRAVGDVNCSGGLHAGDIVYMVNYIFKSGPEPCGCIVRRI